MFVEMYDSINSKKVIVNARDIVMISKEGETENRTTVELTNKSGDQYKYSFKGSWADLCKLLGSKPVKPIVEGI